MFLVSGATGNVGSELVQVLLDAGQPVRALIRTPDRSLPAGAEPAVGDLNDPRGVADSLRGVSGLFLMSGYTGTTQLLDLAARAGVERVVLLSGGAAAASDLGNPVSRYMLVTEDAVRASALRWTILRPFAFASNATRWADQVRAGDVVTLPFADVANAVIDPCDIARVAARALTSGGHEGQTYRLSGPESLLPADQVAIVADVLGRQLEFVPQSNADARAEMEAGMPVEYVDAFFSFYVDHTIDESKVLPTVDQVTGAPPRSFRQWAELHVDAFR